MWQPLAALCKKPSNAYPLCLLPNYGTTIEQTVTLAWQYIHVCHFLLAKHVLSLPKNTSSFGSRVTDLVLLIIFLLQLSESEPDRQVDSGMLKRVNPGHPVTLISWIINGLSRATLQHVWTQNSISVSWEVSKQPGHALRTILMSEVKSMACINALCVVNYTIGDIRVILITLKRLSVITKEKQMHQHLSEYQSDMIND